MVAAAELVRDAWADGLAPTKSQTLSEWADEFRMLTPKGGSAPGSYETSKTPYVREIADCLSDQSPVRKVVWMKGSQIGATEVGNNWVGYVVHRVPSAMMAVQPTLELAKRLSKIRLAPMFEETPELLELVGRSSSRDSGNTTLMKDYPNGVLVLTGSNSAVGLRSLPFRYGFFDEIDAWEEMVGPAGREEGDPLLLARRGMRTFETTSKEYVLSTPTIAGRSKIESEFEETDQRFYHVPCPRCGGMQDLFWTRDGAHGVVWDEGDPSSARYLCQLCDREFEEYHKTEMLAAGEWIARAPELARPDLAGFHLNALYSPIGWYSWAKAADEFTRYKKQPSKLRVWINQTLGECYEEKGDAPPWETLYNRREDYQVGWVPAGGLVLTCGVDVQKDRMEGEVVAWGRDLECWSIDYFVIDEDAADEKAWNELRKRLSKTYPHELGLELPIQLAGVDAGYETNRVYNFTRTQGNAVAVMGARQEDYPAIVGRPQKVDVKLGGTTLAKGASRYYVGTGTAKREIYGNLRLAQPTHPERDGYPSGYCHFPMWPEDFFKQLTSEQVVLRLERGFRRYKWEVRAGHRNEGLDARVYARACAAIIGVDRATDEDWGKVEAALRPGQARPKPAQRGRERRGYLDRWRGPRPS